MVVDQTVENVAAMWQVGMTLVPDYLSPKENDGTQKNQSDRSGADL